MLMLARPDEMKVLLLTLALVAMVTCLPQYPQYDPEAEYYDYEGYGDYEEYQEYPDQVLPRKYGGYPPQPCTMSVAVCFWGHRASVSACNKI